MLLPCPRCNSPKIFSHHQATKITAGLGLLGGAAGGISSALMAKQFFVQIETIAMPLGMISKAILSGLAGGVAGCLAGAQLGHKLDRHVLANNCCLLCGHRFNLPA
ncbi:hypothetical protein AN467_13055 [Pseudomonas aeruginosa]|uniref:hypothetical protein n=1 Tax=Pseudomonas aeruginosa TaxID=287 RepID=UPI0008731EDD|nr:hypothetical protein [Pseudomonas aeruginosa]OFB99784.1 hypothetical protein AN467_13055 [Pseudomonas aeruginosa]